MELEVTAEVHTVHPSAPVGAPADRAAPVKPSYGSWCTPQPTPAHTGAGKTNSNIESNFKIEDEYQSQSQGTIVPTHKVQLFAQSPPPLEKKYQNKKALTTELKDFSELMSRKSSIEKYSNLGDMDLQPIESPQSPVPTSPQRDKKCKGWRLPTFCNPKITIDPQGKLYISWLFLVTFCYSYNSWCIALRATFPYQTPENTHLWMMADYVCDLIYLLDVALVKPRLMYLQEGFWVDNPSATKRYYKSKLQFKFDLISLMPLDILYLYFGPKMVILRFPRILKLQTFWEFHRAVDRVVSSPYAVRVGKTLFYIFYLIHLNACAYYAMSVYIGLGSNGWVYDNQGNAYIRCFYFATKTATSIGKNPRPENLIEYMYMTVAWLMGVFVFAVLIGQIRDIYATATRARTDYKKALDESTRCLRRLGAPPYLQRRVTAWFNYTWRQQRCFDESRILDSLPLNMKRDVALEVHISTLSKVHLFRDCSESLLRDLVLQLRPVTFLPGDVVVRRGDVGHQMYIIQHGECYVMSPDGKDVVATLHEGSVFGEISLLGIDGLRRRTATVRSRGYSNLFALSKSDLDAALKYHREAEMILRLRADHIIRENAARQTRHKMAVQEARRSQDDSYCARRGHGDGQSALSGYNDGHSDRKSHEDGHSARRSHKDGHSATRSHEDRHSAGRGREHSHSARRGHKDGQLVRRKHSAAHSDSSESRRHRCGYEQSRKQLPSVTENPGPERNVIGVPAVNTALTLPKIIFTSD